MLLLYVRVRELPLPIPPLTSSAASQASNRGEAVHDRNAPAADAAPLPGSAANVAPLRAAGAADDGDGPRVQGDRGNVPAGTSVLPDRLPPPNVLRHHDLAIKFRAGHTKRGVAGDRFASYSKAATVAQFFNLGGRNADWNWDIAKGIVSFVDPQWQALAERSLGDTRPSRRGVDSRGRMRRLAAYVANVAFHAVSLRPLQNASHMSAFNAVSYDDDFNIDVARTAEAYQMMKDHRPLNFALTAQDIDDSVLDHLLLHFTGVGISVVLLPGTITWYLAVKTN